MKILHYLLGFPPHRSGGLTKYAFDLMVEQMNLGHDVVALYPGNFSFVTRVCRFRQVKTYCGIPTYCLTNALPVPLMYGISSPNAFISPRRIDGFSDFVEKVRPDIFHIHTLMGLPKELLLMMKERGIRIVYTSHDYFGLCPRVNFINSDGNVCEKRNEENCRECGQHGRGCLFLKLRNAEWVVLLKKLLK